MTPKEKAKQLVNCYYQPLGMVKQFQKLNSKQMWKYAQDAAKAQTAMVLDYPDITSKDDVKYWKDVYNEIDNV